MLKFVCTALFMTFAGSAFGQNALGHLSTFSASEPIVADATAVALPGSLSETMKAMSKILKSIDATDTKANAANAASMDQFVALVLHSKTFTPDSIGKMPQADQAAAQAHYEQMLDQTADLGRSLAQAFRANDNVKAAQLMDQLGADKKSGHGAFK